ncbi:hypothetical protein IE81DRAFT_348763 [Ceraceosorus guamensis]|uniref:Uncharacterized protein n=1 Tax=Ceraceosorus guamensis TaxID=1522189 RepID=A0A316VTR4_9BASI|nr:hypothetical protein IE81DRAFT_348763 [Ceraceosorus guamensis]PWN40977.1 hypothetical protein IE81DRAFT_348763 [Ceraceosorus guamensis]
MSCRRRDRANGLGCCPDATGTRPWIEYDGFDYLVQLERGHSAPRCEAHAKRLPGQSALSLPAYDACLQRYKTEAKKYSQYAGQQASILHKPKYACFDCRRAFKPTACDGNESLYGARGLADLTTDGQIVPPTGQESDAELSLAVARTQHLSRRRQDRDGIYTHPPGARPTDPVWLIRTAAPLDEREDATAEPVGDVNLLASPQRIEHYKKFGRATVSQAQELFPTRTSRQPSLEAGKTLEARQSWIAKHSSSAAHVFWRQVVTCCPGCGKEGVRVGSTFRAPSKKDAKAWESMRRSTLEQGNRWDFCKTNGQVKDYNELAGLLQARWDKQEGGGRVRCKDRDRERVLRDELGLSDCDINISKFAPKLCLGPDGRWGSIPPGTFCDDRWISSSGENLLR